MPITKKRMSIALSKEDLRLLNELSHYFEETPSLVIKRALMILFYTTFNVNKQEDQRGNKNA